MRLTSRLSGLLLVVAVAACAPAAPDEEQIRQRIDDMSRALAERDARAFLAPVADDFSGVTWNLDRRGARVLLNREMRAHQRLRARLFDIEVVLHGETRATATMHAVLTGGSGLIPERGNWYRVRTGWRKEGSNWMLVSAEWEPVAGR